MITDKEDACWYCDQWVYTLIFWDKETIGENARLRTNPAFANLLIKEVKKINPEFTQMIAECGARSSTSLDPYSSDGAGSKE